MTERITTPFGATSTADEVIAGVDLTGRRAIVTGGASGIGVETARALAAAGAEVTLAVRDVAAGEAVAAGDHRRTGNTACTSARWIWPTRRRSPRSSPAGRAAAHPRRQRRHHGDPGAAHARGLGAAVRHQPPRPLRARHRAARRARRGRRRSGRRGQLGRARQRRRSVRRRRLRPRAPTTRGRPTPVQDGKHAVRGRGRPKRWAADGIAVNALNPGRIAART